MLGIPLSISIPDRSCASALSSGPGPASLRRATFEATGPHFWQRIICVALATSTTLATPCGRPAAPWLAHSMLLDALCTIRKSSTLINKLGRGRAPLESLDEPIVRKREILRVIAVIDRMC